MLKQFRVFFTPFAVFISAICLSCCASGNYQQNKSRDKAKAIFEKGTSRVYRRGGAYSLQTPRINPVTISPAATGLSSEERSQKIAEAVTELDEIQSATAVITGNTVIIGVQTDYRYSDSELIDIKRLIEAKVKATDKGIDHVSVTTATDLVGRINRMPDAGASEDPPIAVPGDFVPRG